MRILFFSEESYNYKKESTYSFGGGWIGSIIEALSKSEEISEMGVSFLHNTDCLALVDNKITYFPIQKPAINKFNKILNRWIKISGDSGTLIEMNKIIESFRPDIIHVFGLESIFGFSVFNKLNIPCVVHIQGILSAYINGNLPYNTSYKDLIFSNFLNFLKGGSFWHFNKDLEMKAEREYLFLKNIRYFMGRTDWDRNITNLLSPNSKYFEVNELLRSQFYLPENSFVYKDKLVITSTISNTLYKGLDVIIKTAKILKKENVFFEWNIIGVNENSTSVHFFKKKYKFNFNELNINIRGILDSTEIVNILKLSTLYVHLTYLDNSPNSLCEAQLMGIPVISTNVGGIQSLVNNKVDGLLVPPNDPYYTASLIKSVSESPDSLFKMSIEGRAIALKRHNSENIIFGILNCYKNILSFNS